MTDFSGALPAGAQESLLEALSDDDAHRSRDAREHGRVLLAAARERAQAAGLPVVDGRLRHGEVIDTLAELARTRAYWCWASTSTTMWTSGASGTWTITSNA